MNLVIPAVMHSTCFAISPAHLLRPSNVLPPTHTRNGKRWRIPSTSRTTSCLPEPRVDIENGRAGNGKNDVSPKLPTLIYLPGLDGNPLPKFQEEYLESHYNVLSIFPPSGGGGWDELATAVLQSVPTEEFFLVGESFGAALALRVAARVPRRVTNLVLVNSGTALRSSVVAGLVSNLLPVLGVPPLYKIAARILTPFLTDRRHIHPDVSFVDHGLSLFDIDNIPLPDVQERVKLLQTFHQGFGDDCIKLVTSPTTIIASANDKLLPSIREANRLKGLLPNVTDLVILSEAPHAALLDKRVSLANYLPTDAVAGIAERVTGKSVSESARSSSDGENTASYNAAFKAGMDFFSPWRTLHAPWVGGLHYVQEALKMADGERQRPVLFVGNHGKYGLLDLPLLYETIAGELVKYGGPDSLRLRGLAHATHFEQFNSLSGGRWAPFLRDLGTVPASARAFYSLLSAGERVLLFPGGAREVCRRRGEEYKLLWSENPEFVRPAAKFDALIVPFAAVGADDECTTVMDGQELQNIPGIGNIVRNALDGSGFDRDNLMPISAPPTLDRYYFEFMEPVDMRDVDPRDSRQCKNIYEDMKNTIKDGVQTLLDRRENDPKRTIWARIADDTLSGFDW